MLMQSATPKSAAALCIFSNPLKQWAGRCRLVSDVQPELNVAWSVLQAADLAYTDVAVAEV